MLVKWKEVSAHGGMFRKSQTSLWASKRHEPTKVCGLLTAVIFSIILYKLSFCYSLVFIAAQACLVKCNHLL